MRNVSEGISVDTNRRDPLSFVFKEVSPGQYEGPYLFGGLAFPVNVKVDGDKITIILDAQRDGDAAHFVWTGNIDGEVIKAAGHGRQTMGSRYAELGTRIELRKVPQ